MPAFIEFMLFDLHNSVKFNLLGSFRVNLEPSNKVPKLTTTVCK